MRNPLCRAFRTGLMTAVVAASLVGAATAADEPANVVKYRTTMMKTLESHLVEIVAVLKGEVSFVSHVPRHAAAIKDVGEMVADMFPPGSVTSESRASPAIWRDRPKFEAALELLRSETAKLSEVAATGDLSAVGAQLGNVGKACGNCHKQFRLKKE